MRKYFTYALFNGAQKVLIGVTNNLEEAITEHRNEERVFTIGVKTSRAVLPNAAYKKAAAAVRRYAYGHGGNLPEYNEILGLTSVTFINRINKYTN